MLLTSWPWLRGMITPQSWGNARLADFAEYPDQCKARHDKSEQKLQSCAVAVIAGAVGKEDLRRGVVGGGGGGGGGRFVTAFSGELAAWLGVAGVVTDRRQRCSSQGTGHAIHCSFRDLYYAADPRLKMSASRGSWPCNPSIWRIIRSVEPDRPSIQYRRPVPLLATYVGLLFMSTPSRLDVCGS